MDMSLLAFLILSFYIAGILTEEEEETTTEIDKSESCTRWCAFNHRPVCAFNGKCIYEFRNECIMSINNCDTSGQNTTEFKPVDLAECIKPANPCYPEELIGT